MRRLALAVGFGWMLACGSGDSIETPVTDEEQAALAEVVSGHTDGIVSRTVSPRVRFVSDTAEPAAIGGPAPEGTLVFDPPLEGSTHWGDARELVFTPEGGLQPGTKYRATVDLGKVDASRPGEVFRFEFETVTQSYQVTTVGLQATDDDTAMTFAGTVRTADEAPEGEVEQLLAATQGDGALPVEWKHPNPREHGFVVKGIRRGKARSKVELQWNGAPLGVTQTSTDSVDVPAAGEFSLASWRAVTGGEEYVELRFSDPLKDNQNLAGLIRIEGKDDLRFAIEGSVVRVYTSTPWVGVMTIQVEGIRNRGNNKLPESATVMVSFDPLPPAVKFASKGVILPSGGPLTVPIEVVNLSAVEIEATRVHDSNVPQFLQVNGLDGDRELERVGQVVWRERVTVDHGPDDLNRVKRVGLDVTQLVAANPNGLYRLKLSFQRADVEVPCTEGRPAVRPTQPVTEYRWDGKSAEKSYWDNSEEGDDGMSHWEAYQHREDPCHSGFYRSYYDHEISSSKNILISDVGLIAKRGQDGDVVGIVNDLKTTAPTAGAQLRVLDYTLQPIAEAQTDSNGMARMRVDRLAFVLEATVGAQRNYARLDNGSSLSISHFDTAGATVAEGLKGYFYGERGVWRPGDPVFLTFVLSDETHRLPPDHPIHFELVDPRGRVTTRRTLKSSVDGFYDLSTRTAVDAPTGSWTARVTVGGRVFSESLRIETVQPNRLKIAFDFPSPVLKAPDVRLDSTLSARWLHGAKAPGLKTQVDLKLIPKATTFAKFSDYRFEDQTARFESETTTLFEGVLDAEGNVPIVEAIDVNHGAPGLLTAQLTTRVWEPSGAFSVDQGQITVSPYERYVGIRVPKGDVARNMLLTDIKHPVQIVTVDADGKPVGSGTVHVQLYKIDWRWWWEKGEENLADFATQRNHRLLSEGDVTLKEGAGTWEFEIKYPEWGRYLLLASDASGGHKSSAVFYADWPGWAGRAVADNPGGASVLSVTTEQKKVDVGQAVTLSFPTPTGGGRALLSLETGSTVLSTTWIEPTDTTTTATFTATADMAPSVYANVTLLQPHGATTNDLPIRMYGIVPIEVVDPKSRLEPVVTAPAVFEPEGKVSVDVSEKSGRAMTYTVAVVDEGLLGLTRFQTPNPWSTFYGREALGVRTWDVYDLVAGAFGAALESMIAVGGDGEGEVGAQPQARRFPPVALQLGTFKLEAGQTRTHDFTMPPYIGEVRIMVVAGRDGAWGNAEKSVPVKKPLMVASTLPRVLGPSETITVPVTVFALDPGVRDVTVELAVEGPVRIQGAASQKLTFASEGDQLANFVLRVDDTIGIAKVTATARGGGVTSVNTVEVAVRHPGVRQARTVAATIEAGQSWNQDLALFGLPGTNQAALEVSRVPPLSLGKRLDTLIQYPHGCVEQTTSGAFPQLMLTSVLELDAARKAQIQRNVKAGIERLRSFQSTEGGMGYWPGDPNPDDWATSYAGHFLVEAERQGYVLPSGMRKNWVAYQRAAANQWVRQERASDQIQAYRLYTLALAGEADLASMNRLKEIPIGAAARYRLAATYHLSGQPETARKLAEGSMNVEPYRELSDTYGSALRDQAMILETLVLLSDVRAAELARAVSDELGKDDYLSTQETAYALVALSRFAGTAGTNQKLAFSWSAGGASASVDSTFALTELDLPVGVGSSLPVTVKNPTSGPLFVRAVTRGLPRLGEEKAASQGLALSVRYLTADGSAVDPATVDHGTDLVVEVNVTNRSGRAAKELALSHIVPGGWELFGTGSGRGEGYDYRDVRDDRVYTYFDLPDGESRTFTVQANAAYRGSYYLAPISVEAMYDDTLSAHTEGRWVEVRMPGEG